MESEAEYPKETKSEFPLLGVKQKENWVYFVGTNGENATHYCPIEDIKWHVDEEAVGVTVKVVHTEYSPDPPTGSTAEITGPREELEWFLIKLGFTPAPKLDSDQ